jgi:hypothetical protein
VGYGAALLTGADDDHAARLHDAEVTIYYIQRVTAEPINFAELNQFWVEWIRDNCGTVLRGVPSPAVRRG